jgi:TolB-like protein/Tfp pilus assembly protein PilF
MNSILNELKRRNVIRVGIAYLAVAWFVLQVAEMLLPVYGFTDAAIRNLVVILAVGLLVTLALSWAFDWTPGGITKTADVDPSTPTPRRDNKRLDRFIIFMLVIAVAFFSIDKFVLDPARDARDIEAATEKGRADALLKIENDKSVAVLPFANRSTRDDDVYFVDGIHDDILTQLARINSLAVTSRTSVEQFRGTSQTMTEIGAALGVRAILEGGVQRAGDRVRINVQLIDAASDEHLWAETYVRDLTAANIFAVQAEIASTVAEALRATLLPEEKLALQETPTENIQAYDLYLLGRYHWNKRTKESIDVARGHFEKAIEQDPDYVFALSGLADSYTMLVIRGNMTGEVAHPLAQQAIDQAMAIDDSVSEVWASLGFLRSGQGKYGEAEKAFRTALELDDRNFSAWLWYSSTLLRSRQDTEALSALQRALELEPMSFVVNQILANRYDVIGEFSRAIQHYDRADQLDDKDTSGFQIEIAWSLFWAGEFARAIDAHRNILIKEPDSIAALSGLALIYLSMGDTREAKRWNDRASAISSMFREGYRVLEAQQDYAGAIVYLEETLRMNAPRRDLHVLLHLFRAHYANGDIESARTYLAEFVDGRGGEMKVHPREVRPWAELAVAEFWMTHGDAEDSEPDHGRELAEEVHLRLTEMVDMGWHRPQTLASLAATEALLGNPAGAIDRLNEAIDNGYKNQSLNMAHPAFETIRGLPGFAIAIERMNALIDDEKARLANMQLPPYTPPEEREPIAVASATLRRYEGWYSNGNNMSRVYMAGDGRLMFTWGPRPAASLLAITEDEFFTPVSTDFTVQFFLDEDGTSTHFLLKGAYGDMRLKRVEDPPPRIDLPRDVLARYEGTFAYDRMTGLEGERTETDYWVAEIYVDEAGKIWIDYDNQPQLEIAAYSETEFQLVGMEAQYRFVADPDTGQYNEFIRLGDGNEKHFYRQ